THRDSHETPTPLEPGRRYRVRVQLNDCGASLPAGHRIRLALSTTYWPMIWPAPEAATVTVLAGALDLPVRPKRREDAMLPALPEPQTATPDPPNRVRPGVMRLDRLGLEMVSEGKYALDLTGDDPLTARAEMQFAATKRRGDWQVRFETSMQL